MARIIMPDAERPYVLIEADREASPLTIDPAAITNLYKTHGALLLRGFSIDLDAFRRFADQFCLSSVCNESGGRQVLDEVNNIQSVNRGSRAFPLHPELSREPWKPDVCFFCCLNPPREQGATTICDGTEIVGHLPPALRQALDGRRLLYIQPAIPEALDFWLGSASPTDAQLATPPPRCPYLFWRIDGQIVRAFSRPALHRPMFTDAPAFGNFLLFARFLNGTGNYPVLDDGSPVPEPWLQVVKSVGDALTVPIAWRRGDLLMLDNTRFMHGRTAIVDPDDRLIASYFGYLRFAPPNPEEPPDPLWRQGVFRPPQPGVPGSVIPVAMR